MNHETMTVHSALCELKMLDKRIQKKIRETSFCANVRHSLSKINGRPISEYEKSVQEAYDSIVGMIARRKAIRNALSLSNAAPAGGSVVGQGTAFPGLTVEVREAEGAKCERCWMHSTRVGENADHPTLCPRCAAVVAKLPQF